MIVTDQINHKFKLKTIPKRIISLVPSQTELLYDLGLEKEVVGITKFCIHPKSWFKNKSRVGGTKTVDFEKIAALKPDLIIANKEENTQSEVEALQKKYNVYTSDIANLKESLEMMEQIGVVTAKENEAQTIVKKIRDEFDTIKPFLGKNNRVLYLIWRNPYMTVNQKTFINDMMQHVGFQNTIINSQEYPSVTEEEIVALAPHFIFLSSEPYPFKKEHVKELKKVAPNSKIILVDGEYFSWYGSRLQNAPAYFKSLVDKIG